MPGQTTVPVYVFLTKSEIKTLRSLSRSEYPQCLPMELSRVFIHYGLIFELYTPTNANGYAEPTGQYMITDDGRRCLRCYDESSVAYRNEKMWTRGLAIVAILISLAALLCSVISLQSQGILPQWIKLG